MKQKSGVDSMDGSIFSFQRIFNLLRHYRSHGHITVRGGTGAGKPGNRGQKHFQLQTDQGSIIDASGTKLAYSTASNSLYITLMKDYSKKTDKGKNRPEAEEMAEAACPGV